MKWLDRRIAAPGPYLTLVLSESEFDSVCKRLKVPTEPWLGTHANATTHFMEDGNGNYCAVVALGEVEGVTSIQIAALLVHESVHIWQRYARRIGEDAPGDEQEAYAIQSISQELLAEYARRIS